MALQHEVHQGEFGENLVQILASGAGLTYSKRNLDVDGVDLNVGYPGRLTGFRYPAIELQIKTKRRPKIVNDCIAYPLQRKHYEDLRGRVGFDFPVPRYLVVVETPSDTADYVRYTNDGIGSYVVRATACWLDLMDAEALSEGAGQKTVYVPLKNILDGETLMRLVGAQRPMEV